MRKRVIIYYLYKDSSLDKCQPCDGYEATISYTLSDDENIEKSKLKINHVETKRLSDNTTTTSHIENDAFKKFYEEMNKKLLNYK